MNSKILVALSVFLLVFALSSVAVGADNATAQEIVQKVNEAASTLSKSAKAQPGEASMTQFNQKQGPFVWKDSYIFVLDCTKMTFAAHPIKPELVGKDITTMKDTKGSLFFGQLCEATKKTSGVWVEYWWPKPGETAGSRKISFAKNAPGTPFVLGAGIYDDKATIAELSKMTQ